MAATALLLAGLGALGPAERERATYSWPPSDLSAATPHRLWYSPLLLIRQVPAEIRATIPCTAAPPLAGAGSSVTVLATARTPLRTGGLSILREGARLQFFIGGYRFASVLPPAGAGRECSILLDIEGSSWSLREPGGAARSGDLGNPPFVSGLFSELDVRTGRKPEVEVTTEPYGARTTAWQTFAWSTATLLALSALLLASKLMRRNTRRRVTGVLSRVPRSLRPVDALVALVLLTWWVVGPVLFDDGWVKARETNYDISRGFSNYYTTYGSDLPLSFWSEWIEHWVVGKFDTLLILRLAPLAMLAGTWIVCRWVLGRLLDGAHRAAAAEWALGIAFALNACAWAVTLRPEPAVALLLVGVLACAVRFGERPGPAPLAVGAILVALGLTAHPAGLVTLAPLLASAPRIFRWARRNGWGALAAMTASGLALLLVLATVSADLALRAHQARLVRSEGDAIASWRDELTRYLFAGAEATTLRRESVALMLVAVLAYLLRHRRDARLDLAGASLGVALLLLIPTPSKWAWHFGTLVGLSAVAIAAEVARLRVDTTTARWPVRPVLAAGAIALVMGWSWGSPRSNWSSGFDLRTIDWTLQYVENRVSLAKLMPALLLVALAAAVLIVLLRRGGAAARRVPWRFVAWLVPLAVLPLVAYNIGTLIRDAVKTPAWTLPRQNVESIVGQAGCGVADDTVVAGPRSMRPVRPVTEGRPQPPSPAWAGTPPVDGVRTFWLLANGSTRVQTPWYPAPGDGRRIGAFVSSSPEAGSAVEARWGRRRGKAIHTGGWQQLSVHSADQSSTRTVPWLLVAQGQLPERPAGADVVQFAVRSETTPPVALAVTGGVAYRPVALTSLVEAKNARPLVWPNLLLYLPCAQLPKLQRGIVEIPTILVANAGLWPLEFGTSAFHGLLDLYRFRDLSGADSRVPPKAMLSLWVDRQIPGAALAPAELRAST